MNQDDIKNGYALFKIPAEKVPHYENPNQFASSFKKCSLYEYVSIKYSGSSVSSDSDNFFPK